MSNLLKLLDDDVVTRVEESTFLNSSTVPTYEEFTKKTNLSKSPKFFTKSLINSTQSQTILLTDDESDEETFVQPIKNPILEKFKTLKINDQSSCLNPTLTKTLVLTPNKFSNLPKTPIRKIDENSQDEYIMCSNKSCQTSLILTNDDLDEDSCEENKNFVINDSLEIIEPNINLKNKDNSDTKEFDLYLSSSSSNNNSEEDLIEIKNNHTPTSQVSDTFLINQKENNVTIRKKINNKTKLNKASKNRVSICGQALSDDVFNIDDTIVDQFDNELDHKKGILFSINEPNDLESFEPDKRSTCLFVSTKISMNNTNSNTKINQSSSDDEAFEKFLNQYKPRVDQETNQNNKNDIKEFIVEDSEEEQEVYEEVKKKKVNRKLIDSRIKSLNSVNSSSSDNLDKSDSDKEYDEQYDKDLQLFYIRTTNKFLNEKKDKDESVITLNDTSSSESESSDSSFDKNSSSDSDDSNDSFARIFRTKQIDLKPNIDTFKTPGKNLKKQNEQDLRLIKTQFVQRKEPQITKKFSFIESLNKHLPNEDLRDPSVLHYINKFHLKSVKSELLNECYRLINKNAFDSQLPVDMKLLWNDKITSTAGYCKYSSRELTCEIHISTKVCTDPERLRDTLAHEMCHAATFLISRANDNHGPIWKSWTRKVNFAFKHIPKITISHSYSITKKFIFKCQNCHLEIHRFSKSINIEKEVCGICHGRFIIIKNNKKNQQELEAVKIDNLNDRFNQLLQGEIDTPKKSFISDKLQTPRQPNKFALYVKENYGSVKKEKNLSSHKDVMQELSKNFKLLSK